jgi:hypothetical protein
MGSESIISRAWLGVAMVRPYSGVICDLVASLPGQGMRSLRALRPTPVNPNCNGADSDHDGYGQNYEHGEH